MTGLYNTAAEMVLQYMAGHKEDFEGHIPNFSEPFPVDQVAKTQPLIKEIAAAVDKELDYQLSEFQCSWAISAFYRFGLEVYNEKNDLDLQPLVLKKKEASQ